MALYCTVDNIFILDSILWKYLSKHKSCLYCAFIDFEKAFDRIDHISLFFKLLKLGMKGKMLKVLKSMYDTVKSCVKIPHGITESFNCTFGVHQGFV